MDGETTFSDLFQEHAAASLDKQIYFREVIKDRDWQLDEKNGTITFSNNQTFSIQILGTETRHTNNWLWGWADEADSVPLHLLLASLDLKALGIREDIQELTMSRFSLRRDVNGHYLAMVASGVCQANCYYRCSFENGALYVLIKDPNFKREIESPLARIAFVFSQLISDFSIQDQQKAMTSYLKFYNMNVVVEGNRVIGELENGDAAIAEFEDNHLIQLALKVT